jgi:hypothetical protein
MVASGFCRMSAQNQSLPVQVALQARNGHFLGFGFDFVCQAVVDIVDAPCRTAEGREACSSGCRSPASVAGLIFTST